MWIKDLSPNKLLHKEIVSVYCEDKARKCGYAVPTQCIDGKLKIPECFERKEYFMTSTMYHKKQHNSQDTRYVLVCSLFFIFMFVTLLITVQPHISSASFAAAAV